MAKKFSPPAEPKDFAKLLRSKATLSPGYASDLARAKKSPSLEKALEFERLYGIPPDFWQGRIAA